MNKYETKMNKVTTEFAEHICDNLCRYPHMSDGKSLEIICSDCKIGKFICDILNEYIKYKDIEEQKEKAEKLRPDFPVLRNNDQRKEFLKGFHDWAVWFTIPEADETYYRYNLPDGSSIVICEYSMWLEWKERYADENPDSLGTELYLLKPGYHYMHDCKSNESAIVEHLKNVQKQIREGQV